MARLVVLTRRAPHGSSLPREALDLVLAAAAFDQDLTYLFDGDGVLQLVAEQDPTGIGEKPFARTFEALAMYEVEDVRVHGPSLARRGLTEQDLAIPVTVIDDSALGHLLAEADQVLSF